LSGAPKEDPRQLALEQALHTFKASQYDEMVRNGCSQALTSWVAAERIDTLLERAYGSMLDAHQAMSAAQFTALGDVTLQVTQAVVELRLFFATLPLAEGALARLGEASEIEKAVVAAFYAQIKIVQQIATSIVSGSFDTLDARLNALGALQTRYGIASVGNKNELYNLLGGARAAGLLQLIGTMKSIHDIGERIEGYHKDAGAAENAYLDAGGQYSTLLSQLEDAVTKMKAQVAACKTIQPTTSTQTQPPPQTGDYGPVPANGNTQSRCAALGGGAHVIRVGDVITFTAGPANPGACAGSVSWIWPPFEGMTVIRGCAADSATCVEKATRPTYCNMCPVLKPVYVTGCISGKSGFGQWGSCVYYAVIPAPTPVRP
jgi:hypothetical protein